MSLSAKLTNFILATLVSLHYTYKKNKIKVAASKIKD